MRLKLRKRKLHNLVLLVRKMKDKGWDISLRDRAVGEIEVVINGESSTQTDKLKQIFKNELQRVGWTV